MTKHQGKLIGIVGYQGSGKTSLTNAAINCWNGPRNTIVMGFSDPMYDMLSALGVPNELIFDKSKWDDPVEILCGRTLRHATRTLGTEWGRNFIGDDLWTNAALKRANEYRDTGGNVIIDNCRFPSEFKRLVAEGATMVALLRPSIVPDLSHVSEQHIADLQRQCWTGVSNAGTLAEGADKLRELFCAIIAN